jgi:hypothetical protein
MSSSVSPILVNLTHEATLRSFWRRKTLWRFLRQHRISEAFLSGWDTSESKRDFLDRLAAAAIGLGIAWLARVAE